MDFDRLLEHLSDAAGQKEQVALSIYYLEEVEEQDHVSPAEVRDVIRRSRSTVSTSSVSVYLRRLKGDLWVKQPEDGRYRLTTNGRGEVGDMLDEAALDNARGEDDLFLDLDNFEDDDRYQLLVEDINETYRYRIYDATMVLTRKFFEDMVYQILMTHYSGDDVQMYYDHENTRHYTFDELLSNFKDGVPTLRQYSRDLDRSMVEDVRDLKDVGNSGAHSIRVELTDEDVEEWSDDASRMAEILYDVLEGARIADD